MQLKRKRDREVGLETRERVVEFTKHCFSFPLKPCGGAGLDRILPYGGVGLDHVLPCGRVGLDHVRGHARAPTKPCESRVYDNCGAHDLHIIL
jgi:hypothetical protein